MNRAGIVFGRLELKELERAGEGEWGLKTVIAQMDSGMSYFLKFI